MLNKNKKNDEAYHTKYNRIPGYLSKANLSAPGRTGAYFYLVTLLAVVPIFILVFVPFIGREVAADPLTIPGPADCFDAGNCYAADDDTGILEKGTLIFRQGIGGMGYVVIWAIVIFGIWYFTESPMIAGLVGVVIALVLQSGGYFSDAIAGQALQYGILMLGVGIGITIYGLFKWKLHQS